MFICILFIYSSGCQTVSRETLSAPRDFVRGAAKACESCCTYCFSHNNCSVKVVSSNVPFRERFRLRTFFFREHPDFRRKIEKSEMKSN